MLLLVLLLRKSGKIPSGYNGFVQKESTNLYYGYHARLAREKDVKYPVEFGENNKEFTDVDFFICMLNSRTYKIIYEPTQEAIGSSQKRHTVSDGFLPRTE